MSVRRPIALLLATLLAGGVLAAEDGSENTVEASVSRAGGTATVTGTAGFVESAPASIDAVLSPFDGEAVGDQIGLGLRDATIEETEDGLRFTWVLSALPAPPPPEAVRYTWSFAIDGATFQLQAKTTNVASVTVADDPAGHVTRAGASFQMRGNCVDSYQGTPVANCPHIGWLDGAFDTSAGTVVMDVPYGFADEIVPGAVIDEHQTATMSVAASLQAAVSNATVSSYLNGWIDSYHVGPQVRLGVSDPGRNPSQVAYDTLAELAEDGSFRGTIEVAAGQAVYVAACRAFTCTAVELDG